MLTNSLTIREVDFDVDQKRHTSIFGSNSKTKAMKCNETPFLCSCKLPRVTRISFVLSLLLCSQRVECSTSNVSSNAFLERCHADCNLQRDLASCGKYRVVRWLHDAVRGKEFRYGPFRIIRIPTLPHEAVLPKLPRARIFRSGVTETLSFVRDAVEDLLTKRAIVYTMEYPTESRGFFSGPLVMDEDELEEMQSKKESEGDWRIFKKKKSLILPLLILLNLFKLKLLLLPIFLGVHFIKKLLVLGGLVLPSVLSHLKVCKVPQPHPQTYPYHTWGTAAEAPVDYPTGYGQDDSAWMHRNDIQGYVGPYPLPYHGYRNPYG